jgi:hypothetical protein
MNHVNRRTGVRDSVSFSCPFCTCATVTAGIDDDDCGVVLHTIPYCKEYRANEPEVFLRNARREMRKNDKRKAS